MVANISTGRDLAVKLRGLAIGACLFFAGCASPGPTVIPPEIRLSSVEMEKLGLYGQTFLLGFSVSNPNAFPLPVSHVHYELRLDEKRFARGETRGGFVVAAREDGDFSITVELDLFKSASGFNTLVEAGVGRTVVYELSGTLKLDIPFTRPVPFGRSGTVRLAGDF